MRSLVLTCLLAACSSESADEPTPTEPGGDESPTAEAEVEPAPEPPADAVLQARAIAMDGGDQPVWLGPDGVVHVGPLTTALGEHYTGPDDVYAGFWRQASLAVVTFDGDRDAIVLALPTRDEEDPANHYWVWIVHEGALFAVFDQVVGTYGVQPLLLPGDGTVRYVEDGWGACTRLEHPAEATRQEVVHRWNAATGVSEERTDTEQVQRCDQLAACPFVYLVDGGEETFVGEVLRDIRGRENAALQPLAIGPAASGALHVRLREEKEEVTFLDELYAEVDGVRLDPVSCGGGDAAFCAADGRPHVMRPGDELDVRFELPAGGELTIWARGYYVPTPTAATR